MWKNDNNETVYHMTVSCGAFETIPKPIVTRLDNLISISANETGRQVYLIRKKDDGHYIVTQLRSTKDKDIKENGQIIVANDTHIISTSKSQLIHTLSNELKHRVDDFQSQIQTLTQKLENEKLSFYHEHYTANINAYNKRIDNIYKYFDETRKRIKQL